jgi:biopolymer transport protein ExbB
MLDMLTANMWLSMPLFLLFFLALALFIERWLALSREATDMEVFGPMFEAAVKEGRLDEAAKICVRHSGNITEVYAIAVHHYGQGAATLRNVLSSTIELQIVPRLRARTGILSAIGKGAPMIGLLGTVFGMMMAFEKLADSSGKGAGGAGALAGEIGTALGTTFLGLVVAVPVVFGMAYLRARIDQFEVDLERYSNMVVDLLYSTAPTNEFEAGDGMGGPAGDSGYGVTDGVGVPPEPIPQPQPVRRSTETGSDPSGGGG